MSVLYLCMNNECLPFIFSEFVRIVLIKSIFSHLCLFFTDFITANLQPHSRWYYNAKV